jgi:hypothetical protein
MKSTVNDFYTQRSECCAWLGLLKPFLSAAIAAAVAADSCRRERCGDWLVGGLALVLRGVTGGLRGLLCSVHPPYRGVPAVSVPDALSGPVAR